MTRLAIVFTILAILSKAFDCVSTYFLINHFGIEGEVNSTMRYVIEVTDPLFTCVFSFLFIVLSLSIALYLVHEKGRVFVAGAMFFLHVPVVVDNAIELRYLF